MRTYGRRFSADSEGMISLAEVFLRMTGQSLALQ